MNLLAKVDAQVHGEYMKMLNGFLIKAMGARMGGQGRQDASSLSAASILPSGHTVKGQGVKLVGCSNVNARRH